MLRAAHSEAETIYEGAEETQPSVALRNGQRRGEVYRGAAASNCFDDDAFSVGDAQEVLGSYSEALEGTFLAHVDYTCQGVGQTNWGGDQAATKLGATLALHGFADVARVLADGGGLVVVAVTAVFIAHGGQPADETDEHVLGDLASLDGAHELDPGGV
jgi:hypothetical protein